MVYRLYTAIPTGPEQGFPSVVFPHRENPVFIAGFPVDENRFFPVGNTTQGKPCFHYMESSFGELMRKVIWTVFWRVHLESPFKELFWKLIIPWIP